MATMDIIKYAAGSPADEIIGCWRARPRSKSKMPSILMAIPRVSRAVFIQYFRRHLRCDVLQRAVVRRGEGFAVKVPL